MNIIQFLLLEVDPDLSWEEVVELETKIRKTFFPYLERLGNIKIEGEEK